MFDTMIDEVIRRFGFEDKRTIAFCRLCEMAEKGIITEQETANVKSWFDKLMK